MRATTIAMEGDSQAAQIVGSKLFTTAWPLARFVLLLLRWSQHLGFDAVLSHIPGVTNDWADELSRQDDLERRGWDSRLEIPITLQQLLSPQGGDLHPRGTGAIHRRLRDLAQRLAHRGVVPELR